MVKKQVFFLSISSGILLSLPWLFPNMGWTLLVAFVPLLLAESLLVKKKERQNSAFFYTAFIAFLIWNIGSTWWIAYVSFSGMMLIAWINALLMTSIWWAGSWVRSKYGASSGFFTLVAFWLTFEFLQYHWAIQWPWLNLGNGLANSVKIIQWYEYTGILGGSFWIWLSNILIFLLVKQLLDKAFLNAIKLTGYLILVIGLPVFFSFHLYSGYAEKGTSMEIVVLQPNIDPYTQKFSGMSQEVQVSRLVSLAESAVSDSTDLIVAPETALPPMWEDSIKFEFQSNLSVSGIIRKFSNVSFIAGAITKRRFGLNEKVSPTARQSIDGSFSYDIFNSALLFDQTDQIQISHKTILVSGVEKIPFQKYFSFLEKFTVKLGGISGSLASAREPHVFTDQNGRSIGPVVCFESAFGEYCTKLVNNGAGLFVVITNDGWWKNSPGSWQHFGYSKLRAIENRRSIARSANTGISGFINQHGDVIKKTSLNTYEALSSKICVNNQITFYARHGDYIGRVSMLLSGLIVIYILMKKWIVRGI